jgi:hypothetical protein
MELHAHTRMMLAYGEDFLNKLGILIDVARVRRDAHEKS